MAAPGQRFFIQDKLDTPFPHHKSFKDLWETKWKKPCEMGIYPFMFGSIDDFQPIVDELIQKDLKEPYNWDEYAAPFFPTADRLMAEAQAAEAQGDLAKASELYLRSSAVYRIARFPVIRSDKQRLAWERNKDAVLRGLKLREYPTEQVLIPHTSGTASEGSTIPAFYHLPAHASASAPVPLLVLVTGLDAYRTDLAVWIDGFGRKGVATLILEIPGTGDSPADRGDPTSPDRAADSLFAWIAAQPALDQAKVALWAFSTGGYYAIRLAHTHPDKCAGVVAHGGGCHYMFDPTWLQASNHLEYPFDLGKSLAWKFGYGNDFERFKAEAMDKYSLVRDGTLDKPCGRLLLVNGTEDSIFPIDDYYLCLQHGSPKEARFVANSPHMGEPQSFLTILTWIYGVLGLAGSPAEQLALLQSRSKL